MSRCSNLSSDIAKDVFGTDDPTAVGEKVKDWDTMKATSQELLNKGYYTFASYADTFRLYGNSISKPWVEDGSTTVRVDPQINGIGLKILKSGLMLVT